MADAILYFTGVCIHISSELQQVQSSEINIMTYNMVVYDQSRENARTCESALQNPKGKLGTTKWLEPNCLSRSSIYHVLMNNVSHDTILIY